MRKKRGQKMPNNEMVITLSLDDQLTKGLEQAQTGLKKFASEAKSLGREIRQVGGAMTMFGAFLSAPFIVALNKVGEGSAKVKAELMRLEGVTQQLHAVIANAILPIVTRFINVLQELLNWLSSIPEPIRNIILQSVFLVGVLSTMGGIIMVVIGQIILLASNLAGLTSAFLGFAAANAPLLIIAGTISAILFLMIKFKVVGDTVMSTFQALFIFLQNGFLAIKVAIETAMFMTLQSIQSVVDLAARIPGPMQIAMQMLSNDVQNASNVIRGSLNQDLIQMQTNISDLGQILVTGEGSWSRWGDGAVAAAQRTLDSLAKVGTATKASTQVTVEQTKQNQNAMVNQLAQVSSALTSYAGQNKKMAATAKVVAYGSAIISTALAVTNGLATVPFWPVGVAMGVLAGVLGAIQIATIASTPLATGTDTVPAMLSPGEMVFPRSMAEAIRQGDISVSGRGAKDKQSSPVYIDINIDQPTLSKESDIDYLTEQISRKLSAEVERIR
jgi:hypothetical protein